MKIKVYSASDCIGIEDAVNKFLEGKKEQDVLKVELGSTEKGFDVMVVYREGGNEHE